MPNIKVIYWNVQNFGDAHPCRGNYVPLCNFIAEVVRNVDADILCLMELRVSALMGRVNLLLASLINAHAAAGTPCDWYFDFVRGSVVYNAGGPAYSPNRVDFTGQGRMEGYAIFWKQNIDKFIMQRADPIDLATATPAGHGGVGVVPNTQSGGVRARNNMGWIGALPLDVNVPAGVNQYTLPAGTNVLAPGVLRPGTGIVVGPGVTAGPMLLNAGDVISLGTQIGPAGVTLNTPVLGVIPIVIPGNYTMSTALPLSPIGTWLLRQHVLSLVLSAKRVNAGAVAPYVPPGAMGPANVWRLGSFPSTAGANFWNGSRRPAFCTIQLNDPAALAPQRLCPITFYHAPLAAPDQAMIRCAIGRQMYETPSLGVAMYGLASRAIAGGDLNERLDPGSLPYTFFTDTFANNGAGCRTGATQNIRINHPAPAAVPTFPPTGPVLTNADNWANKSTVQLRHPIVPPPGAGNLPVLSAQFNHYRRSAIDNIFYRGFTLAEAPLFEFRQTPWVGGAQQHFFTNLYDLIRAVSGNIPPGAAAGGGGLPDNFFINPATIAAFWTLPAFAILAMGGPPPALNQSLDPVQLLADVLNGIFLPAIGGDPPAGVGPYAGPAVLPAVITHQRRAAEFIKLFVSDHLPAIFEMDI